MQFSFWWQYLKQPLWDKTCPAVLNPFKYWHCYQVQQLDSCLYNTFLEQCWESDYQQFVSQHHDRCSRRPQEEDPVWLLERCWYLKRQSLFSYHPENLPQTKLPKD